MKMYDKFCAVTGRLLLLPVSFLLCTLPVTAASYSPVQLTEMTHDWLATQLTETAAIEQKIVVHPLDARLPEKHCDSALTFELIGNQVQRQNTVKLQCPDAQPWQLFLSVKISQLVQAVVSTRQLPAGSFLTSDMLALEHVDLLQSRGALVQDPQQIIGARTKRSLNSGQILVHTELCLVCKGDIVTIEGVSSALSVTTKATALQDGTLGDDIRVQNLQSKRIVTAQITAVKRVEIKL